MSECVVPQLSGKPERELKRVEGLPYEVVPSSKEMDILKDLPSFDSENFSRFLSHGNNGSSSSHSVKKYVKLKRHSDPNLKPQMIVMDPDSLILKELEVLLAQKDAAARRLKRSYSFLRNDSDSSSSKVPRTDDELESWPFDYS